MVGTVRESSASSDQASVPRQKQASAVEAVSDKGKKSCPQSTTRSLLQECVAGEMAQPEAGVSSTERRVWGEIFQSRQNFVDMHCC